MYTTFNPVRYDGQGNQIAGECFQQIQICPYFLTWALPLMQSNLNIVALPKTLRKKLTAGLAQRLLTATKYTPIDGLSLFDKVMLHAVYGTSSGTLVRVVDRGIVGTRYYLECCD
jgi:hypothetical protein